ncbi:hypothetical protein [uncultured Lacinutrix sp.]|uniref:hypothetical protein n=1 Tax=uncultured Lacinutrix sp. TaxID=574032 RepID=UPI002607CF26|nr:hypothetical protein [uncultured Lacinutrix sp.]
MLKNILFKIIKFSKNLFFIKRLVALAILAFIIYMFSGDLLFMSKAKKLEPVKAKNILNTKETQKYMLLSDYKIDCNYPFMVKKVFKKDKISHFYLPLVSLDKPKEIIALISENAIKDSTILKTESYAAKVNLAQNYFEKDIETKLLNGEKEFYIKNGFQFSDTFMQLKIDAPPTAFGRYLIAVIIASLLFLLLLISFIPNKILSKWFNQYTGIDYSFGNKTIKKIVKNVEYGKYNTALEQIKALTADQKTQAIDALALMLKEKQMQKWKKAEGNSAFFKLVDGSRQIYDAWEKRGYAYATETDEDSALGFLELLEKGKRTLSQVQGFLKVDANNLLISVNKGLSEKEVCKRAFQDCISAEPKHTMAHLNYLDVILPKWLGSEEEVDAFIIEHSKKSTFLECILKAKWLHEKVNYNEEENYTNEIESYLNTFEPQIHQLKTDSPNKYILYNYLYFLADEVGNKKLSKRYEKKLKEYLSPTLYSPLRSAEEIKRKLG